MQVFPNGKQHFHSFIAFYVMHLKNQEVKIWSHSGTLTRPNLHIACSVAKLIIDFFWFWCSTKPFQITIDIKTHLNEKTWKVKSNLELETTKHMQNCIFLQKNNSTSKFVTKETSLLFPQTLWQSMRWLNSPMSDIIISVK